MLLLTNNPTLVVLYFGDSINKVLIEDGFPEKIMTQLMTNFENLISLAKKLIKNGETKELNLMLMQNDLKPVLTSRLEELSEHAENYRQTECQSLLEMLSESKGSSISNNSAGIFASRTNISDSSTRSFGLYFTNYS